MKSMKLTMVVVACLVLVVAMGGCKHTAKNAGTVVPPATEKAKAPEGLPEVGQEDWLFTDAGLKKIYFDFDKSAIRPDQVAVATEDADKIKKTSKTLIQIEGHCDERGTQEYNMALGERRALAVRDFFIKLGVSGDRLITISYGKEKPEDAGHSEAAWSKNRRAQFNKGVK